MGGVLPCCVRLGLGLLGSLAGDFLPEEEARRREGHRLDPVVEVDRAVPRRLRDFQMRQQVRDEEGKTNEQTDADRNRRDLLHPGRPGRSRGGRHRGVVHLRFVSHNVTWIT